MVGIGKDFYLRIPDKSKRRVLHPAKVTAVTDGVYSAELEEKTGVSLKQGQEVIVYFRHLQKFLKQPATIDSVSDDVSEFTFTMMGEPASAEDREFYRVSTVVSDLRAKVGSVEECALVNVSLGGFAVVSSERYEVGDMVEVKLSFDGRVFAGKGCVQSVRELDQYRIRYGMVCADDKRSGETLRAGLHRISMYVQRQQLRRLAGVP